MSETAVELTSEAKLRALFRDKSEVLAGLIVDMLRAEPGQRRTLYRQAMGEIRAWLSETRLIMHDGIQEHATDENEEKKKLLLFANVERAHLRPATTDEIARKLTDDAMAYFSRAMNAVSAMVILSAGMRRDLAVRRVLHTIGASMNRRPSDSEIRRQLRRRLIMVTGSDGKLRHYEPENYAALVLDHAEGDATKQVAIQQAKQLNADLVQISEQPSTIPDGCFCNIYRGKVFSLSGKHPICPPLSTLPSGGAPMHNNCRHFLLPIDAARFTDDELTTMSRIPAEFRQLGERGGTAAEFMKLYHSKDWNVT